MNFQIFLRFEIFQGRQLHTPPSTSSPKRGGRNPNRRTVNRDRHPHFAFSFFEKDVPRVFGLRPEQPRRHCCHLVVVCVRRIHVVVSRLLRDQEVRGSRPCGHRRPVYRIFGRPSAFGCLRGFAQSCFRCCPVVLSRGVAIPAGDRELRWLGPAHPQVRYLRSAPIRLGSTM